MHLIPASHHSTAFKMLVMCEIIHTSSLKISVNIKKTSAVPETNVGIQLSKIVLCLAKMTAKEQFCEPYLLL